jgi:hypothetical protein
MLRLEGNKLIDVVCVKSNQFRFFRIVNKLTPSICMINIRPSTVMPATRTVQQLILKPVVRPDPTELHR